MTTRANPCRIPPLPVRITRCPNGCVHLHYGPASLALSLEALADLVGAARGLLAEEESRRQVVN